MEADEPLWQEYNELATRSYGHPVGDITRLRDHADIRVAVRDGRVIAGGLSLLLHQFFGGAPVPSAIISAGAVAPEERGDRIASRLLTERLRPLRENGAVISTVWTTSNGHLRRLGWQAPVPVFAWSIATEDLKRTFTRSRMDIEHGRAQEGEELQRRLAQQWNGPILRPDWWPGWLDDKRELTTYRFGPPQTPTGLLSLAMKRHPRHGMELTVHDFWAADTQTVNEMMAFLGSHHTRAPAIHFRRSALPPYPTLLHHLHRYRLTAEAWHPWMLRILDLPEAIRLRGWPTGLNVSVPLEIESETGDTWQSYLLEVKDGTGQISATPGHGDVRLTRGQLAVWYAGGYQTAAAAELVGVAAKSRYALTQLIRATTDMEPWLPDHI
ncbi:GNAT family N-acetyltransferase [Streptomyces sp. NEAU-Y11]|uniref:GNAT family N-acetyltransferase n=1 Tax=Streptomyces cucumeris TaxID=2962890 RepID=UPI0020C935BC|nr:GNAT family N-acetyltransferase [Streptomyces sp. NEAU-Y11]MCP9211458.1 GNAT family N-acetyltransferase [Streptomyces sp. NEAU-Y11]